MKNTKSLLHIFLSFLKMGFFTFGGGWSIVEQMRKDFVVRDKTITEEDLLDMTSIGRSLPGTMIGNAAVFYGNKIHGVLGAFSCVLGMSIGPLLIISIITTFYTLFQDNVWVLAMMKGIRATVCPIMISAIIGLVKSAFKYPPCFLVAILSFSLYTFLNIPCAYLVLIGIVFGLVICEIYERRGKKDA